MHDRAVPYKIVSDSLWPNCGRKRAICPAAKSSDAQIIKQPRPVDRTLKENNTGNVDNLNICYKLCCIVGQYNTWPLKLVWKWGRATVGNLNWTFFWIDRWEGDGHRQTKCKSGLAFWDEMFEVDRILLSVWLSQKNPAHALQSAAPSVIRPQTLA